MNFGIQNPAKRAYNNKLQSIGRLSTEYTNYQNDKICLNEKLDNLKNQMLIPNK